MTPQDLAGFTKPVPHGLLLFGVGLFFFGVVYTCMGESYERFYGWIYRSKEPTKFWWSVATYYLLGIFCIVADVFGIQGFLMSVLIIGVFVHIVYLLIRWMIRQKQ